MMVKNQTDDDIKRHLQYNVFSYSFGRHPPVRRPLLTLYNDQQLDHKDFTHYGLRSRFPNLLALMHDG